MATTTTNFGWDIPQSTDLVKDGATAIAALGQDIDTAFVDFKGGTTGQVLKKTSGTDLDVEWGTASSGLTLINTTSFSAVSSQSINDVFSTTYQNYRILLTGNSTTNLDMQIRLRVGGSDNSTASSYVSQYIQANSTTVTATRATNNFLGIGIFSDANKCLIDMTLCYPFTATPTQFSGISASGEFNAIWRQTTGTHNQSTSYTGFTLFPSTGTMTGEISVYGFNK
jgi:hypothetical protein